MKIFIPNAVFYLPEKLLSSQGRSQKETSLSWKANTTGSTSGHLTSFRGRTNAQQEHHPISSDFSPFLLFKLCIFLERLRFSYPPLFLVYKTNNGISPINLSSSKGITCSSALLQITFHTTWYIIYMTPQQEKSVCDTLWISHSG